MEWSVLPHIRLLMHVLFFHFGGGLPVHKIHFLIFHNPLDVSFACFTNSSLKTFLSNTLVVLSLLRCSCHLVRRYFILILSHDCCFRPWSLMPLLHSGPTQCLILDVHPLWVLDAIVFLTFLCSLFFPSCPLRTVGRHHSDDSQLLERSTIFLGPDFPE
jgi:hypothetical protein